ncbi:MAG: SLC13 family permease [Acidobacteria bacterium]|nr:SLC13 family permease [Acidobacteriota bacterium]
MGWKDLSELAPQLTESEVRFEKKKRTLGLFLGPLVFLLVLFMQPFDDVSPLGMRSLAVFCWIVIWWITEAIPIPATALLALPLLVICGIVPYQKAFSYWAHWANIFLLGAFIIGHAMHLHGLTRRFSLSLVASKMVGGNAWRLLAVFLIANIVVTAFISNVVSAVLFLAMGLGLLEILKIKPGSGYGMAMFLGIAWATNIGSVLTPSGTPTNMIAIGLVQQAGYRIGYTHWIAGTLVFTILQTAVMFVVLRLYLSSEETRQQVNRNAILEELRRLGPFNRGEKFAAAALGMALLLWVLPDVAPLVLGRTHPVAAWLTSRLNWGVVSLLVAISLFVMPLNWKERKFVMTWDEAVKNIEWGTMALVGGALAVGELVGDQELGLGKLFSSSISSIAGPETSRYLFLLATITFAAVMTNLVTNVAVISVLAPIALAVGPALGLNPIALTVTISVACVIGYATPMANPPCAIVFASGYIRIVPMLVRGSLLTLMGILILSFVGYPIADWIFTWPPPTN